MRGYEFGGAASKIVSRVGAGLITLFALGACQTSTDNNPVSVGQPSTTATAVSIAEPATTAAVATSAPASGQLVALDVLAQTAVQNEHQDGYDRDLFPTEQATIGGCNLRSQVLKRDSVTLATFDSGCKVLTGSWTSPYDGIVTTEAPTIDIDHVVALKEAWDSGAWSWDAARRGAFATDLTDSRTLRAVTSTTNESKGDRDPSNWMPPAKADECPYLADWIAIKARWSLTMDGSEAGHIKNLINGDCPGLAIAPWTTVAALVATPTTTAPTTSPPTTEKPTTTATTAVPHTAPPTTAAPAPSEPYYANCTEARAAGVTPLYRGDPGYRSGLDRDNDGIACE